MSVDNTPQTGPFNPLLHCDENLSADDTNASQTGRPKPQALRCDENLSDSISDIESSSSKTREPVAGPSAPTRTRTTQRYVAYPKGWEPAPETDRDVSGETSSASTSSTKKKVLKRKKGKGPKGKKRQWRKSTSKEKHTNPYTKKAYDWTTWSSSDDDFQ
ncbi:uncharacterized protein [Amphiura filiformis]|uniref:uncharacterized protein n=1 Tax=Amphiura filiformis TaxID=82378 RepID=UPI003B2119B3